MTTLDARLSLEFFDMSDGTLVDFSAPASFGQPDRYAWNTSDGHSVFAFGSGITANPGTGYPTGGSVSLLKLDLEQDGDPNTNQLIDVFVTRAVAGGPIPTSVLHCRNPEANVGNHKDHQQDFDSSGASEFDIRARNRSRRTQTSSSLH